LFGTTMRRNPDQRFPDPNVGGSAAAATEFRLPWPQPSALIRVASIKRSERRMSSSRLRCKAGGYPRY